MRAANGTTRVAYFMSEYPRRTDTFVQREVSALRELGAEVETYSLRRPGDDIMVGPEQIAHRAATTYLLDGGAPALARALLASARHPWRTGRTLGLARRLARPGLAGARYQLFYLAEALLLARRLRLDGHRHLHAHYGDVSSTIALLAARLAGVRFSFTLHGPAVFFEAHTWHLGDKIDEADFVACISWFCRSQAQLLASPTSAAHLHIVHCGVDPDRYHRAEPRSASEPLHIGCVARLEHVKGCSVLLAAVADLVHDGLDLRLSLVGDGPDRARFEREVDQLGLGSVVTFHGARSQDEVAELLSHFDVFVLPSFAEGVPVVLMEAMAAGLPVVATQVGGVGELVEDGVNGHIVPPGDPERLAQRLRSLATDPEARSSMGKAGRALVETDFHSVMEADRLLTLFRAASHQAPHQATHPLATAPTRVRPVPTSDPQAGTRRVARPDPFPRAEH